MYVRMVQQSADKSKRFSSQKLRSFQAFSKRTSRPFLSLSFLSFRVMCIFRERRNYTETQDIVFMTYNKKNKQALNRFCES